MNDDGHRHSEELPKDGRIVAATSAQLAHLVALDERCFQRPWGEAQWRAELEHAHARVCVLFVHGETAPVGSSCSWQVSGEWELHRIAVEPLIPTR